MYTHSFTHTLTTHILICSHTFIHRQTNTHSHTHTHTDVRLTQLWATLTPAGLQRSDGGSPHYQPFQVVIAIDFGTTASGYAYSLTHEPESIHMMRRWEGGDPGVANQKTPTCLLLTPAAQFHSFGFAARDCYHDLEPEEAKHWLYFDKFKMKIHSTSELTMDTELEAVNGKRLRALQVFSHALSYFRHHALMELADHAQEPLEAEAVRWVITVPAIWKQPAKQFMREAAYLVSEEALRGGECSLGCCCCQRLRCGGDDVSQSGGPQFSHVELNKVISNPGLDVGQAAVRTSGGDQYIVADCGGGTVDLTVHQIEESRGTLKELYKASGGPHGALGVDLAFEDLLGQIFGWDFIRCFKLKRPAAWVDLMIAFEARKRTASPNRPNALNISLPFSFIDFYRRHRSQSVEAAIRRSTCNAVQWSSQGMLRLSPEAINQLFQPTIKQVLHLDLPQASPDQPPTGSSRHRREIRTSMQFGDTEIRVTGMDMTTARSVKVAIDFLSN
uniref:Heat shock protein 12B n=1 Tax=Callorhinchus milii TaxID=7868 RepID=A0A4W3INM3_CALMI